MLVENRDENLVGSSESAHTWPRLRVVNERPGKPLADDVVLKAPLFAALEEEAATAVRRSMIEVNLGRGQILFREGDFGDRLYVVAEGKIKIGRSSSDGRESLLSVLGPGDMFGELTVFDPDARMGTASAVTDSRLYSLSADNLRPWLAQRPDVSMALLRQLSRRLRRSSEVVSDLVFSDVPGRVAKSLLDLSERFGIATDEGVHVAHDLTQEELAQLVGASRETVNKALADFSGRGWLRLEARAVVILDVDRLRRRAR
ncbi:MAG: Crp/Fnr family transcriptional regulator [Sporichthyaceae bacterium]